MLKDVVVVPDGVVTLRGTDAVLGRQVCSIVEPLVGMLVGECERNQFVSSSLVTLSIRYAAFYGYFARLQSHSELSQICSWAAARKSLRREKNGILRTGTGRWWVYEWKKWEMRLEFDKSSQLSNGILKFHPAGRTDGWSGASFKCPQSLHLIRVHPSGVSI